MLNEVLQKSVMLSLANGSVVEGFVVEQDDEFLKLVEFDNSKVIVRKGDVSYVKIYEGNRAPHQISAPENSAPSTHDENQYMMPHQFVQQAPAHNSNAQYYVIRGKAQHQQDYSMNNSSGPAGPKFERNT